MTRPFCEAATGFATTSLKIDRSNGTTASAKVTTPAGRLASCAKVWSKSPARRIQIRRTGIFLSASPFAKASTSAFGASPLRRRERALVLRARVSALRAASFASLPTTAGSPAATLVAIAADVGRATSISEWRTLWSAEASLPDFRGPSTSSATCSSAAASRQVEAISLNALTAPLRMTALDDLILDSKGLTNLPLSALERSNCGRAWTRGVIRSLSTTSGALNRPFSSAGKTSLSRSSRETKAAKKSRRPSARWDGTGDREPTISRV